MNSKNRSPAGRRRAYFQLQTVAQRLRTDLSAAAGAAVEVRLQTAAGFAQETLHELDGDCIDGVEVDIDDYDAPRPDYLHGDAAGIVSPLTAGGIHSAWKHGWAVGEAIARHLRHGGPPPEPVAPSKAPAA